MKKFFLLFLITLSTVGLLVEKYWHKQKKQVGTVIILNGPSGTGKSSLQKAFQKLMLPNLWIKLGIDNLFDYPLPDIDIHHLDYWQQKNEIRWVETIKDKNGHQQIPLFVGEQGEKVIYSMNQALAVYAKNGCSIIVDYIAYKQEWLVDLQKQLANIPTYYIALKIPLKRLEEREKARGTSPVGHARSHYDTVYGTIKYDLELDAGKYTSEELAQQLKTLIG